MISMLLLFVVRGGVVLALALLAMPLLRRAPASARRLVLALALGAALVAPVASRVAPAWRIVPAVELPRFGAPVAEPAGPAGPIVSPPRMLAASPTVATNVGVLDWRSAVFALWALGAVVVLARLGLGLARAQRMARDATPVTGWPLDVIGSVESDVAARAPVRITDALRAPAVTGVLRPVVLMPREALDWSPARWRVVLVHELAHVRQLDGLAQVVADLACAAHWFNPLVWVAARRLRLERELAADEGVLASGAKATAYAEHLMAIADGLGSEAPSGALAMASPGDLAVRVEAIVRPGAHLIRRSAVVGAVIVAGTGALVAAVACATSDAKPEAARQVNAPSPPDGVPPARSPLAAEVAALRNVPVAEVDLTIDARLQTIVDEEMARLHDEAHPEAATAVVLDVATGAVLAVSDAATARRAYVPGSTFKVITLAAALEANTVRPGDLFDCRERTYGDGRVLHDASSNGTLTLSQVLATSSNVGLSRIHDTLAPGALSGWMRRLHFGEAPPIELPSTSTGAVPAVVPTGYDGALVAIGARVTASPLQIAALYAAIADGGVYRAPTLVRREAVGERIMRADTAARLLALLESVVTDEAGTGRAAAVSGVRVAGKTGTADFETATGTPRYWSSFVGVVPADKPRVVLLVGADVSHDTGGGGKVAAPVFARIAARALVP